MIFTFKLHVEDIDCLSLNKETELENSKAAYSEHFNLHIKWIKSIGALSASYDITNHTL